MSIFHELQFNINPCLQCKLDHGTNRNVDKPFQLHQNDIPLPVVVLSRVSEIVLDDQKQAI
jgi:hypothetical protein